jgi:hypothetical protein
MSTPCIPPLPDPLGTGIPQCPDGYTFDPVQNLCCPNQPPPVNLQDPTIRAVVTGMADTEFDPAQAYKVGMQGVKDSGLIERIVVAFLRGAIRLLAPLIEEAASLLDDVLAILAEVFQAAQGQQSTGYYRLAGAMITDLTGVEANGEKLAAAFQTGGRQAAMRLLGGSIFDTLAAEFANETQATVGGAFQTPAGTGIAGLPGVTLSPEQGVAGGRAFLGYAAGFAIREGNTDMLAAYLPHGIGEMFKDFAEDFAKNLGIGRMARLVWKPLVSTLVATPMQQALNQQYRPMLLDAGQAYRAFVSGDLDDAGLAAELALHGLNDKRQTALFWQHIKGLDFKDVRLLSAVGVLQDADVSMWLGRIGHGPALAALLMQAEDIRPLRESALAVARHFTDQYLLGRITRVQFEGAVNSVRHQIDGTSLLTDGEVSALLKAPAISSAAPRRHLSVAQLFRDYEDGLITLSEFSDAATQMGYSTDEVTILEQELLISAKRAADRLAKQTAAAQRGFLAKLSVAQIKTAFEDGLIDVATVRAELEARHYAPAAVDTLVAEFLISAKLRQPTPPTA